jgi:hypothetical protein
MRLAEEKSKGRHTGRIQGIWAKAQTEEME